jgi:hypothetical protein
LHKANWIRPTDTGTNPVEKEWFERDMPERAQSASIERIVGRERAGERRTVMVVVPGGNAGWLKAENGPVSSSKDAVSGSTSPIDGGVVEGAKANPEELGHGARGHSV